MTLGATALRRGIASADGLADPPQPVTRPCKLDTEDCEAHWYDDERRAGRHDHDYANRQHGRAHDTNDDPARDLVREVKCLPDQSSAPYVLIL